MFTTKSYLKSKHQVLLLLFLLLSTTATSEATSKNATANTTVRALIQSVETSSEATPSSAPSAPSLPVTTNTNSHLLDTYAWGHNTKYATVIFDENFIAKGSTLLDIKYPTNDNLSNDYTIIGIYASVIDKLHFNDVSVSIVDGGVERNFATIRFESKASDDIEFNLKIFGVNV